MLKTRAVAVLITDSLISPVRARGYFGIQNPHATNILFVTFNTGEELGRLATILIGVKVGPGEFYEVLTNKNSGEIRGITTGGTVDAVVNEG